MTKRHGLPGILAVAIISALFINVHAQSDPYNKFRNRTYSNRGYLSEEDEMKLGEQVHRELLKQARLVEDPALNRYIDNLGQKLARNSGRPNIQWHFYVVDDKSINAFATLGGRVYVHTGLLAATTSEAQLASVLGHEIGHIVGRHGLENVKRSQKYGTLAGIAQITGAILGGQAGAGIGELAGNMIAGGYLMKHSRDAEREADYLGLYNMNRAGYNTGGMVEMFQILQKVTQSSPNALGGVLASHPPAGERAANTSREINEHLRGSDRQGVSNTNEFERLKFGGSANEPPRRVRPRN